MRIARPLGPCPRPDNNKLPFGIENDPCSEPLTFPIQCMLDPFNVPPRWIGEAKVLDLQGNWTDLTVAGNSRGSSATVAVGVAGASGSLKFTGEQGSSTSARASPLTSYPG